MRRTGESFKEFLNQAILKGLANDSIGPEDEPMAVALRPMGLRQGSDAGRLNSLGDEFSFLALTSDLLRRSDGHDRN